MHNNNHPVAPVAPRHPEASSEEEIEIPEKVLVRCPLVGFQMRAVSTCVACSHFRGLADRFPGGKQAFAIRYAVLCAYEPVKRELFELEA